MKKIYSLLIVILITSSAYSQTYKPMLKESKTWDVNVYDTPLVTGDPYCATTHSRAFLLDTLVSGISYFKLNYYDLTQQCTPNPIGGYSPNQYDTTYYFSNILLREDTIAKKVFGRAITDTADYLIYDFSVNVGDIMYSSVCFSDGVISNYTYCSFDSTYSPKILIDSITPYTLSNGEVTRAFYGTPINFSSFAQPFKVIEGIGGYGGFSNPFYEDFEVTQELTCVKDSGEIIFSSGNCGYFVGTEEYNINNFDFKMFPNPNNGNNITITGDELEKVEFYNIHGQQIKSILVKNDNAIVKLNNQPKGIYFVKVHFKNGTVSAKKLIIK